MSCILGMIFNTQYNNSGKHSQVDDKDNLYGEI